MRKENIPEYCRPEEDVEEDQDDDDLDFLEPDPDDAIDEGPWEDRRGYNLGDI